MTRPVVILLVTISLAACRGTEVDHQSEWRDVMRQKKAAAARAADQEAKQAFADSLSAFVRKHPDHSRAREVYQRIQLEFAGDLARLGRYQDSIRFYRAVLTHDPDNEEALRGMRVAFDRLAVTREKLLVLEKGMTQREVAVVLGKPIPGWVAKKQRHDALLEAWYYRTVTGGLAGVYFRNGKLLAAEDSSHERTPARSR